MKEVFKFFAGLVILLALMVGTDSCQKHFEGEPSGYNLTLRISYPRLGGDVILGEWDGSETVGVVFGRSGIVPGEEEFNSPGLVAKPLKATDKVGVFAGDLDMGGWTIEDIQGIIYPYDENTWVREGSDGLHIAMHTGGQYEGELAYTQVKSGEFTKGNAPIFYPFTYDDLKYDGHKGSIVNYFGAKDLRWGSSFLRFNIYGMPEGASSDERLTAIRFQAGADVCVFGNTEYVMAEDEFVVNGNPSNTAYVKIEDTPLLSEASSSNPIIIYSAATIHDKAVSFGAADNVKITAITDKSSYELKLSASKMTLEAGSINDINVDLSKISSGPSGSEYQFTFNLNYPKLNDGTSLYRWTGNEKIGLLFGNVNSSPSGSEYPSEGTVVAKELPAISEGVFSGTVDLGDWTLEDLQAVVYPCDEHSWIKLNSSELRVVMHTGGGYTKAITYNQPKSGALNPDNTPVFAPVTSKDLKEEGDHIYSITKDMQWGCALMKVNIFGKPEGASDDEYVTGMELFTATSKSLTGNSEYKLSSGDFAINGNKANCAQVNLSEQIALASTSEKNPIAIYTALAARQGSWTFGESGTSYVKVNTNKGSYQYDVPKQAFNIFTGTVSELNVKLGEGGGDPEPPVGNKCKFTFTLDYPKTADGATIYEWSGNETIGVLFGNTSASPSGSYAPDAIAAIPVKAAGKGVFSAEIDLGSWTVDDIQAVVYPYDGHSWIKNNSGELRLVMHTGGEYKDPIVYSQEKSGLFNPDNLPVFAPVTKAELTKASDTEYSIKKTMQWGCSIMKFQIYGVPEGASSDETLKRIELFTNTSKAVTGNSEYKLTGSSAGTFAINGEKNNLVTVDLKENASLAKSSQKNPVVIYAGLAARQDEYTFSNDGNGYLNAITNKGTYKIPYTARNFNLTTGVVSVFDLKIGESSPEGGSPEITVNLSYPSLTNGNRMYEWDGTETVGLLFGNASSVPDSKDYNEPGLVAKPLKAIGKGVFSGVIDLGEWTLDDLQAIVYPYDEHSWIRNGNSSDELRLAIHSGGRYGSGDITYNQPQAGRFNPANAPVFTALTKKDLIAVSGKDNSFTVTKSLNWGTALMCLNIYGTPANAAAGEYITNVLLFPDTPKAVIGNTEHKLTGSDVGGIAINGNKSNLASIKLGGTAKIEGTTKSNGIGVYTGLAARQSNYEFSTNGEGYVKVITNKSVYTVPVAKASYNLTTGVLAQLDVDLSKAEQFKFESGAGSGSITFNCSGAFSGRTVTLNYYIPSGDIATMPVQLVMHGVDRNGSTYRNSWIEKADQYKVVILAPTFSEAQFPESDYQTGNIVDGNNNYNSQDKMIYTVIEDIFSFFVNNSDSKADGYNLWGHSAGGQFAHRFSIFAAAPHVKTIVAANPGWYTVPDASIKFPYGWGNLETTIPAITREGLYAKNFVLMLGTKDTARDSNLRVTPEADAQGKNRYERGNYYFNWCKSDAQSRSLTFNWKKVEVEGVAHDQSKMAPAAADYLYGGKSHASYRTK